MFQLSLKSARVNAGMTAKEVAERVGVHHQTIGKYEKDSSDISVSLLNELSELYQIPVDYIFLGKEYELLRTIELKRKKEVV